MTCRVPELSILGEWLGSHGVSFAWSGRFRNVVQLAVCHLGMDEALGERCSDAFVPLQSTHPHEPSTACEAQATLVPTCLNESPLQRCGSQKLGSKPVVTYMVFDVYSR